jgi:methylenetetrahydrofolate--tRNA-(uracil-5-)-methyltransferase
VTIDRERSAGLPPADWDSVIVATGPLTSPALADAIAPDRRGVARLLRRHRPDRPLREHRHGRFAWCQSRYDKAGPGGTGADYINCPLDREQYEAFVDALLAGEKTEFKEWEASTPYFDGCLPIEVMASSAAARRCATVR